MRKSVPFLLVAIFVLVLLSTSFVSAAPTYYRFEGSIATIVDDAGIASASNILQNDTILYEFLIDYDVDGQTTYHVAAQPNGLWTSYNPDNPYVEMLSGSPYIQEVNGGLYTGADWDVYAYNFGEDVTNGYAYFQIGNDDELVHIQSIAMDYAITDWQVGDRFQFSASAYDSSGNLTRLTDPDITLVEVRAVPIPAAALLLGSGLIGLAGIRRKMKK